MPVAIFSDVHSNLEALQCVVDDAVTHGAYQLICLGDLMGYGPNPVEVIRKAVEWEVCLSGEQDKEVTVGSGALNPKVRAAQAWIRQQLQENPLKEGGSPGDCLKFLSHLPTARAEAGIQYFHGSPRDPSEYILPSEFSGMTIAAADRTRDLMSRVNRLCFVGHTGQAGVLTDDARFVRPEDSGDSFSFDRRRKYIVNPGSVGVPHRGDAQAEYAILLEDKVVWRRVEYNADLTLQKIRKVPALKEAGSMLYFSRGDRGFVS